MPREFAAALVMTGIIIFFGCQLSGPEDEQSLLVPRFLLLLMGIFNAGQYLLALVRHRQGIGARLSLAGYPLRRVAGLCALTVLYICVLEWAGFYLSSFLYLTVASLLAQPMRVTPGGALRRAGVSFICIACLYLLFSLGLMVQIPKGFMPF
ncbi:tripartite tricarboxylate transporter TctB family protein [uncultured Desulfovibrio sp.]|uniref:tripartite tricarboxylate transporter TctB family protein n=1 Tax=uncultured Desulfovibrio sp. TaxID=167968 RepID=UPI0025EBF158|nr:tripartite tricarboxylate transporter TctB family protein [uncultured Desulfovibrio sp.]